MANPPFVFLPTPLRFIQDFSYNIVPLEHWINTKINSRDKAISSFLEDWKKKKKKNQSDP